jgi:beta-lactamase regulating signal transducer with metallopeptidase domain
MNDVFRLACECFLLLISGSTLVLGLGCLAVAACRSPVHRQRLAELTVGGFFLWLVLTLVPLPRLAGPWLGERNEAPVEKIVIPSPAVIETLPLELEVPSDLLSHVDPPPATELPQETHPFPLPDNAGTLPIVLEEVAPLPRVDIEAKALSPPNTTPTPTTSWWAAPGLVTVVVTLYLFGSAACAGFLLIGYGVLIWIRATGQPPPAWLDTDYQQLRSKACVPAAELLVSGRCSRPISWGLLRPAIVLPEPVCREASRRLVGAILLHELGHVARHDAWGNLLFCLAKPLLYGHPLYWYLRREWNLAAELVADDWAAWQTGKDAYVEELMDLARTSPTGGFPFVGATAVFSSPSQFYRRMQMLLVREQPLSTRTSVVWQLASVAVAALTIALASSLGGVRPAVAQEKPTLPAPTPPAAEVPPAAEAAPPGAPEAPQPPQPPVAPVPPTPAAPVAGGPTKPNAIPLTTGEETQGAKIEELKAQQAVLEAQLKALQARLQELGVAPPAAGDVPKLPVNANKTINVTRVDEDGRVWSDTWATDPHGRPGKLMRSEQRGTVPVEARTKHTSDGKVFKVFEEKDGAVTVHVYDEATGKFIETRREPTIDEGKPRIIEAPTPPRGNGLPPGTTSYPPTGAPPVTVASATRDPQTAAPSARHRELDLVSLATSYADAMSNLETAQANLANTKSLASQNTVSKQELALAEVAVGAAQRKEQLLQRIVKVALEGATKELGNAAELHKAGVIPASGLDEMKTRVEILKQILNTPAGGQDGGLLPASSAEPAGDGLQRK